MKKTFVIVFPVLSAVCCFRAADAARNPFFDGYAHQFGASMGAGVNGRQLVPPPVKPVPFSELHLQYSVPTTMFYLPARFSMNVSQTVGFGRKYGWDWTSYSIPILYLTQDVSPLHGEKWYAGLGAGGGFQLVKNERISSTFLFTFKIFMGYRFTERMAGEFYVKHFSNGTLTPENYSYGFYGLGITYNF
ncbi:MAG: acyloxyacyl hydrolase [Alphaproteobacteria bacterium]|nr:acyloxyacyl hydrolase [Alphaproteobacteria bacterium]MCL2758482.1 acyloxyacyl hydrolase [Alphaproteobacteria bacterium]